MTTAHRVVDQQEWLRERRDFLAKEKAFTRARDELNAARRALPWVRIDKDYRFQGAAGELGLADLFAGRSQLLLYHFMFHPDWEQACKSCSFWADGYNGIFRHLAQRDVNLVVVSRAPLSKLQAFASRCGWEFPWYSSEGSEFNHDFRVSFTDEEISSGSVDYNFGPSSFTPTEAPGLSVFCAEDDGSIYRTYSCYARGLDMLNVAYHHLDLVPKGRDEDELPYSMAWLDFQDQYDTPAEAVR
jgi:predicted dithiol-disulfide oxidoreductase (DUF899 family)